MKNKLLILALPLILVLTGCTTTEYIDRPYEVKVPVVIEIPEPPELPMPELPVDALTPEHSFDEIAKAYAASIKLLKAQNEKLDALFNALEQL